MVAAARIDAPVLKLFPGGDPHARDKLYSPELPVIPIERLPTAMSMAARIALQNGYVLDDRTGRILGRIDIGEAMAALGAPAGVDHLETGEPTRPHRQSGFIRKGGNEATALAWTASG